MKKRLLVTAPLVVALVAAEALAQTETTPQQTERPKRPAVRQKLEAGAATQSFADVIKRHVQRVGASLDESKTTPDMVVSNYPDPKGGRITVVIVNDRRKNMIGFYIYNFGSLKNVTHREDLYKYLLSANDAITIGSFFVDSDSDIGYKYFLSAGQPLTQVSFDSVYLTMAAVVSERRPEIRQMLNLATNREENPPDVKKAADEKPPDR